MARKHGSNGVYMKRTKRLEIRLSKQELVKLTSRAGAMRLGSFMRAAALDRVPPQIPSINRDALAQIGRIGNNVNQIAVRLNTDNRVAVNEVLDQLGQLRIALIEARSL